MSANVAREIAAPATIWTADVRERLARTVAHFDDANDPETLAAARAVPRQVDLGQFCTFIRTAELPEPAGGGWTLIIGDMLTVIRAKLWALKSDQVCVYNALHETFAATGRLNDADLTRLHQLHRAALR